MLGLGGAVVSGAQVALLERDALAAVNWAGLHPTLFFCFACFCCRWPYLFWFPVVVVLRARFFSLFRWYAAAHSLDSIQKSRWLYADPLISVYLMAYVTCLFFIYYCVPILLQNSSAVFLNLSYLTSNFYGVTVAVRLSLPIARRFDNVFISISPGLLSSHARSCPKACGFSRVDLRFHRQQVLVFSAALHFLYFLAFSVILLGLTFYNFSFFDPYLDAFFGTSPGPTPGSSPEFSTFSTARADADMETETGTGKSDERIVRERPWSLSAAHDGASHAEIAHSRRSSGDAPLPSGALYQTVFSADGSASHSLPVSDVSVPTRGQGKSHGNGYDSHSQSSI